MITIRLTLLILLIVFGILSWNKYGKSKRFHPYSKNNNKILKLLNKFVNNRRYSDIEDNDNSYIYKLKNNMILVYNDENNTIIIKNTKKILFHMDNDNIDVNLLTFSELKNLLK